MVQDAAIAYSAAPLNQPQPQPTRSSDLAGPHQPRWAFQRLDDLPSNVSNPSLTWIIDVSELEFITNPVTFRLDGNKGGEVGAGLGVFRP